MAREREPFILAARCIALLAGSRHKERNILSANAAGCSFDSDALVYDDQIMEIVASPVNAQLYVIRKLNNNPVLWIRSNGETIRYHGEIAHLYNHMSKIHKEAWQRRQGDLGDYLSHWRKNSEEFLGHRQPEDGYEIEQDVPQKGVPARTLILAEFPYDEIIPLIGKGQRGSIEHEGEEVTYNLDSPRLTCFQKSPICVGCGRVGVLFRLEWPPNHGSPHLNLYSEDGSLITHDHIIPKSKYVKVRGNKKGLNAQSNLQTMCSRCNSKKADAMPEGKEQQ